MRKIGIITFHTALNYGAVLQAYALQKSLDSLGMENEIIDYRSPYIEKCYKPLFIAEGKIANSIIRGILFGRIIAKKRNSFNGFITTKLKLSKSYDSVEQLSKAANQYKFFITGSDQVWSPTSVGFDRAYFLPFAHDWQKFSYAASIGKNELSESMLCEYKKRLDGFTFISIRERSNINLINKIDNKKEVLVHIDPTLLLTKEEWSVIAEESKIDEPYILVFNVEKCVSNIEYAKRVAKKRGLKLVYINERTVIKDKDITYIQAAHPEVFLSLFLNAKVIVTNSFHGTVFSLIFQKEFYVELENRKQQNTRAEALLEMVGVNNNVIKKDVSDENIVCDVNWESVNNILALERKRTFDYFKKIDAMNAKYAQEEKM